MKAYSVSGTFQMGRNWQPFTLETVANSKDEAIEWTLATLGSRHRATRRQVKIDDVHSESLDQVQDAAVQYALEHEDEYEQRKSEDVHV